MDPAALLREARRRADLTQTELAERAGVARSVVSAYERGHRSPGLKLLSRLLAAADCQLKAELEPLGADVDSAVRRALASSTTERADRVAFCLTDLAAGLAGQPYLITGLAAAVLQGAPVEISAVEITVGDDEAALLCLCDWLVESALRIWDGEQRRWVLTKPIPLLLRRFTPTRWIDFLDTEYVITVAEPSLIRADVQVAVGETLIPVAGLWTIEESDEHVAAVLARTRELAKGNSAG
jgi:transcriptional regulator with XRE-family HTH domain